MTAALFHRTSRIFSLERKVSAADLTEAKSFRSSLRNWREPFEKGNFSLMLEMVASAFEKERAAMYTLPLWE